MADPSIRNEGEGNRTAARHYNEKTKEFIDREDVERRAEDAASALDSAEGEELRRAEEAGKAKIREEDPQVKRHR
ncbi:MAG: hypothetical protein WAS73_11060 [Defluviicoccus sp.]